MLVSSENKARRRGARQAGSELVDFEIAPGQSVQIEDGNQDKAREHFVHSLGRRGRGLVRNPKRERRLAARAEKARERREAREAAAARKG